MKLKKILLIGFFITFLTGCSVDYNVSINKDLSVDESFNIVEEKSVLKNEKYNSLSEVVEEFQNKTTVNLKNYDHKTSIKKNLVSSEVTREYGSIDTYIAALNKIDLFSNESKLDKNEGIYTFTSKVNYKENEEMIAILYKIDAKIGITVPFEVVDNNADSVDEKSNTYYWNLKNYVDSANQKSIKLSFDTNKPIISTGTIIRYAIIGGVIVIGLVAAMIISKKSQDKGSF